MTTHIMVDIETLSTRPGAIVISAAFVRCSDEAHIVLNLSVPDQQALRMEIDPKTHAWWGEQEAKTPGIWARVTENPVPIATALPYISNWLAWAANGDDWLIWCHGATFDCPLLDELYRRAGIPSPWQFWQVQCTRTAYNLASVNPKDYAVPPPHVALNDALGQSRALMAALRILARAHRDPAVFRYFHHPESGSVFFTEDGSHPAERGGIDACHCEEIDGGQYLELQKLYGVAA